MTRNGSSPNTANYSSCAKYETRRQAGFFYLYTMEQIVYKEFRPDQALAPFIDAFWTITGNNTTPQPDTILPDGCVDIILNTGPGFPTHHGTTLMNSGEAYLVGTMTRYIEMVRPPATRLVGIRFKPGGFSFFYDHTLLRGAADRTIEFDRTLIPSIDPMTTDPAPILDRFFTKRLSQPKQPIQPLITAIRQQKGQLTVSQLARRNFITIRQLERLFQLHLDLTPKAFINFVRCQSALQEIRSNPGQKRLLDIACECGYYDHAHLSNEIKKYTGSAPSAI